MITIKSVHPSSNKCLYVTSCLSCVTFSDYHNLTVDISREDAYKLGLALVEKYKSYEAKESFQGTL